MTNRSTLSLLALLALPAFAQEAAPKPAEGAPAPAPTTGAATTATPKGQGVKKVKPGTVTKPEEQKTDEKK
jgi:hypothetical protein